MARSRRRKWLWLGLVVAVLIGVALLRSGGPKIPAGSWLVVDLDGVYVEGPPDGILTRLIEERKVLVTLLSNLSKAARDERIVGVVAKVGMLESGWAQAAEIREALDAVKSAGKRVVAFLRADMPSINKEYYVASVADRLYVAPGGAPMLNGLAATFYFLGGVWEKLDISMHVEQMREYKTFGDMIERRQMTAAHREMANSILDSVNAEFLGTLAQARGMSEEQIRATIDACPTTPDAFVEAGLADGVLFADQVKDEIGDGSVPKLVKESTYTKVDPVSLGIGGGPKIAVVHAAGTIVPGTGNGRSLLGMTVGSQTLVEAFEKASEDADVHAIVFRIDSPGGSASASDEVWRSARQARARKPVVASLGDTAASGGYYMAAGADRIVADATTLTGSIGVVMFKPDVSGLFGNAGVNTEALTRGRFARLFDLTDDVDKADAELLRNQMEHTYRLFLERVAEGRGMTTDEVDKIGGGRVWTGRQAAELGLIDQVGGLREAVRTAARQAGIEDPGAVELVFYPKSEGLIERLSEIRAHQTAELLPRAWRAELDHLGTQALLGGGVHAFTASALTVR